jgi:hypothetical protein
MTSDVLYGISVLVTMIRGRGKTMSEANMSRTNETECRTNEEHEDYLDYCAAAEAIDEALETGEVTPLEDFIKELGLEKDCGL